LSDDGLLQNPRNLLTDDMPELRCNSLYRPEEQITTTFFYRNSRSNNEVRLTGAATQNLMSSTLDFVCLEGAPRDLTYKILRNHRLLLEENPEHARAVTLHPWKPLYFTREPCKKISVWLTGEATSKDRLEYKLVASSQPSVYNKGKKVQLKYC
jgi:hypothetical protein